MLKNRRPKPYPYIASFCRKSFKSLLVLIINLGVIHAESTDFCPHTRKLKQLVRFE
jgi:hypothetical protein